MTAATHPTAGLREALAELVAACIARDDTLPESTDRVKVVSTYHEALAQAARALLSAAPAEQPQWVFDPECKQCQGSGRVCIGSSGREDDGNAPIIEDCDCLIPAEQPSGWRDIATAPKDGTRILLGRPADLDEDGEPREGVAAEGYWQDGFEDQVDVMGHDACWTDTRYDIFSFPRSFGAEAYRSAGYQPTLWQPLPPPPAAITDKRTALGEADG